ncbi:hypothetical protein [Vibrio alfacsensis]|jgi:hypothetical protein|uniref:hypothetical protein n=1 Tax=Vibrio TaxID=662 RepID=UPI00338354AB
MNTELQVNLNKLKTDIKDAVFNAQPVRYNGDANRFIGFTGKVIDEADYELGDRQYLKNSIAHRLKTTFGKDGKRKTNWSYKQVIEVAEDAFKYINK